MVISSKSKLLFLVIVIIGSLIIFNVFGVLNYYEGYGSSGKYYSINEKRRTLVIIEKIPKAATSSLRDHVLGLSNRVVCFRPSKHFRHLNQRELVDLKPCPCETDILISHLSRSPIYMKHLLGHCPLQNIDILSIIPLRSDRINSELSYSQSKQRLNLSPNRSVLDNKFHYNFNPYLNYSNNIMKTRTCVYPFIEGELDIPHSNPTKKTAFSCLSAECRNSIAFIKKQEENQIIRLRGLFSICNATELSTLLLLDMKQKKYESNSNEKGIGDKPVTFSSLKRSRPPYHLIQIGPPRTATTLQFQCICLSLFLKLENTKTSNENDDLQSSEMNCHMSSGHQKIGTPSKSMVFKTHKPLDGRIEPNGNYHLFATASSKEEAVQARTMYQKLYNVSVMYVQDIETVSERGHHIINIYADIFGLNTTQKLELLEYVRFWDILRLCCGKQMATGWRAEQQQQYAINVHTPNYHACSMYNIDTVEELFMNTTLYKKIMGDQGRRMGISTAVARPSLVDDQLFGTYCSKYNDLVKEKGVQFNRGKVKKLPKT